MVRYQEINYDWSGFFTLRTLAKVEEIGPRSGSLDPHLGPEIGTAGAANGMGIHDKGKLNGMSQRGA